LRYLFKLLIIGKNVSSVFFSPKKGKEIADPEVADKLFKRATGYSHPDVDIKVIDDKVVATKLAIASNRTSRNSNWAL
jgi:hypothetical protein